VASSIFHEKMQHQLKFSDFAVLYRTNSQSRAIEEALRRMNIKYKVVGGLSFYQRKGDQGHSRVHEIFNQPTG
jgi:DNA helicase-2/ATP-dependent DNA helicase PcrA